MYLFAIKLGIGLDLSGVTVDDESLGKIVDQMIHDLTVLAEIAVRRGNLADKQRRILVLQHGGVVNGRFHHRRIIVGIRDIHQKLQNAPQRGCIRVANLDPSFIVRRRLVIEARRDHDLNKISVIIIRC